VTFFICSCVGVLEGGNGEQGASCNINCVIFGRTVHLFLFMWYLASCDYFV